MTRRMSCSMTIASVQDGSKTVTRRHIATWLTLKPGARLTLIEKGMGLPKGARQVELATVEIVDVRDETLGDVTQAECDAEGFPDLSPAEFAVMWARSHGYERNGRPRTIFDVPCRRIEWRYL